MSDKAVRTAEMQRVIEQTIHAGISPQRTDDGLRIVCKTRSFDDYELELHLTAKARVVQRWRTHLFRRFACRPDQRAPSGLRAQL
jgi:hypothetical protein